MKTSGTAAPSGWLGHRSIPRPAVVRREHRSRRTDGLDCLLAIWIAQAMLETSVRGRWPASPAGGHGEARELLPSTGTP